MNDLLIQDISIELDESVKHISREVCMVLSGILANGLVITQNPLPRIIIYKDKIEFGRCLNPDLQFIQGNIIASYYKEYSNIVYHFPSYYLKCSFFDKTIEYAGPIPVSSPDDEQLFRLIYPRFV